MEHKVKTATLDAITLRVQTIDIEVKYGKDTYHLQSYWDENFNKRKYIKI